MEPGGVLIQLGEGALPQVFVLGWGDVDVVEGAVSSAGQQLKGILLNHFRTGFQVRLFQISANGLHRGAVEIVDAGGFRAAAEGFDPNAAGSAEQVQPGGVLHIFRAEDVKERLFDHVGDGAGDVAGHHVEPDAAGGACDDAGCAQCFSSTAILAAHMLP